MPETKIPNNAGRPKRERATGWRRRASALLVALALGACEVHVETGSSRPGAQGFQPLGILAPERWTIDGEEVEIASSYFLKLGDDVQYTLEVPHRFAVPAREVTAEMADAVAFPILKHAVDHDLHTRTRAGMLGSAGLVATRLGVVLLATEGGVSEGYRYGLSLAEIRARKK